LPLSSFSIPLRFALSHVEEIKERDPKRGKETKKRKDTNPRNVNRTRNPGPRQPA
jgi:hypothetical protein